MPDAGRRIAKSKRANAIGVLLKITQRLCGRGGHGDEVIGRRQVHRGRKLLEIRNQHIVGEFRPHLFRRSGATLIVAQHAKASGKPRRDGIPRMQSAAKFVQQDDGMPATAGELVVKAHAVGVQKSIGE